MMTTDSHEGNYLQTHRKQAGDFAKTVVLARVSHDIDPPDSVIGGWTKSPRFARQAIIEISQMLGQEGAPQLTREQCALKRKLLREQKRRYEKLLTSG
jgi:hypothetical protein